MSDSSIREYIGARYVPIFGRKDEDTIEWDNTDYYEPLTIVLYQGNSYTSRQFVPIGIDITNTDYWAQTGNYNAQIELYRQETQRAVETAQEASDSVAELAESIQEDYFPNFETISFKSGWVADDNFGYYVAKIPRANFKLSIKTASGSYAQGSAYNLISDPDDNSVLICDGGIDGFMMIGTEEFGSSPASTTGTTSCVLSFDNNGSIRIYNSASITGTQIRQDGGAYAIQARHPLVIDNVETSISVSENINYEIWDAIGIDNNYWYIAQSIGRAIPSIGCKLTDFQDMLHTEFPNVDWVQLGSGSDVQMYLKFMGRNIAPWKQNSQQDLLGGKLRRNFICFEPITE